MIDFAFNWFKIQLNRLDTHVNITWFQMMIDQLSKTNYSNDLFGEQVK
jgi:hypothetical protein